MPPKATTRAALSNSRRRSGKGLTFDASYTFTRDLSNAGGATPTAFAVAGGSFLTDRFHPGLDYGNVIYDRRHRFLANYLYDLPFGHGQRWLANGGAGQHPGWRLATGRGHHPSKRPVPHALRTDRRSGQHQHPHHRRPNPPRSVDKRLALCVATHHRAMAESRRIPISRICKRLCRRHSVGIGRFGNAPVGGVVGPGTANFSLSLMKIVSLAEQVEAAARR